ncbi:sigma-70 family RNA polymerase sigma factor [Spirosoma fluminis]
MYVELTDWELALRLTQNDKTAFKTLFYRYHGHLYTIASQYLKDPVLAKEALQDVYLKLWNQRHSLDLSQPINDYLATAMRRYVLNHIRNDRQAILRHIERQHSLTLIDTLTDEQLIFDEYNTVVRQGLDKLPAQRQLVFILRSVDNLTDAEVASNLEISINSAKVHYQQACLFLRDYLRQHTGVETLPVLALSFVNLLQPALLFD